MAMSENKLYLNISKEWSKFTEMKVSLEVNCVYLYVVEAVCHGGRLPECDLGPGELVGAVEGDDGAQPHAVRQLRQLLDLRRERRQRGRRRSLEI